MITRSILITAMFILVACSGGTSLGGGSESGDFDTELGLNVAAYVVLDLRDGSLTPQRSIDNFDRDEYRDTKVIFRAVSASSATIGQEPDTLAAQADESPETVTLPRYLLAVFELSQAQWQRIAGTQPWSVVPSAIVEPPAINPSYSPAYGISLSAAEDALSTWSASHAAGLALPSGDQWEVACRAGDGGLYMWNEPAAQSTITTLAVVSETAGNRPGPKGVGDRQPNAWGFRDMHGNVWEWTSDELLRGGSWSDPLLQARAANRVYLDPDVPHPLVGVRPILILP